jgi:serine kinase of HPr protein (carbohydrate metabolism regulator)
MPCFTVSDLLSHINNARAITEDFNSVLFSISNEIYSDHPLQNLQIEKDSSNTILSYKKTPILEINNPRKIVEQHLKAFFSEIDQQSQSLHGNFLEYNGIGILLRGESGQGKSVLSLSLIERGAKLVSDDITHIYHHKLKNKIYGYAPELLQDHIHIKGLPVINLRQSLGVVSIKSHHSIDFVIELSSRNTKELEQFSESKHTIIHDVAIDKYVLTINDLYAQTLCIDLLIKDRKTRKSGYNSHQEFIHRQKGLLD